jgi:glycosyltransferase involved in cell wall biosynthesis
VERKGLESLADYRKTAVAGPRIVYLQYTNPAGYPPLEHSSRILGDREWRILFLGIGGDDADALAFPHHPAIQLKQLRLFGGGPLLRLHYLVFIAWALWHCIAFRAHWVYASDPPSCLPALVIRSLLHCKVLYHEHDSPAYEEPLSRSQRFFRWARRKVARGAELCVLPQRQRMESLIAKSGRKKPSVCVWNCPRLEEASRKRAGQAKEALFSFYYHGSLNCERLPFILIDALARVSTTASLFIVGYETIGSKGYVSTLMARAEQLGLSSRVHYLGALHRGEMLQQAAKYNAGLALMPVRSGEINMANMTGASNKVFDYMAVGIMPLVSDLPDWREMFVEPGFARACDPSSVDRLAAAFSWCVQNAECVREMGEMGRQKIVSEWNYERQFAPVLELLVGKQRLSKEQAAQSALSIN